MGLYSNSINVRNYLESRNLYSPDNIYDINKNIVTQTLNTLQKVGFDPRSSRALNTLEAIVQNTPIVRIGAERLAIEFARKAVDSASNKLSQSIHVGALFDGDPSTKLFRRAKNWTISPSENENKFNFKNIADKLFGVNDTSNPLDKIGSDYAPGSINYYKFLGSAQRDVLESNVGQNFYSVFNFKNNFTNVDGKNSILRFLYSDGFIARQKNQDDFKSLGYVKNDTFSYVRDKNIKVLPSLATSDPVLNDLNNTLNHRDQDKNILEEEGFGFTDKTKSTPGTPSYNNIYNENDTFKYNNSTQKEFGIERGLLYYTNQIAKISKNLNQDTIQYKINDDGTTLYKGASECRSFTLYNQYGETKESLIRFDGNNEPDSVMKNSVFMRVHPVPTDFDDKGLYKDDTHFMFSIENLAYTPSEWNTLPYAEKGPNRGRLMWFPPYGLTITENAEANWESEKLLGRIEPIYTYNGAERIATIKFMLLIDTPPNVNNYEKWDLAKYFSGCDVSESVGQNTNLVDNSREIKKPADISSTPPVSPTGTRIQLNTFSYYFQNDVDTFIGSYELTKDGQSSGDKNNLFGLNAQYTTSEQKVIDFLKGKNGTDIKITIEGYASKLAANDYNIKLSLRRAFNIGKKIANAAGIVFQDFDSFLSSDKYIKSSVKDKGKSFVFKSTGEKKATIVLTGFGEPDGKNEVDNDNVLRPQIDSQGAKSQRYCHIEVDYLPNTADSTSKTDIPKTSNDIQDKNATDLANDNSTTNGQSVMDQGTHPFLKTQGEGGLGYQITKSFDSVDYYKPTFHSQTPFNFWERQTFLHQLTRPGSTIDSVNNSQMAVNSIFGKSPSCILRIGDFWHSRIIVNSIQFEYGDEMTWDLNPEGMGVQPNLCTVTMNIKIIGGQSMKYAVDQLQTAIDQNFFANSTFNPSGPLKKYYDVIKQNRTQAMDTQNNQAFIKSGGLNSNVVKIV